MHPNNKSRPKALKPRMSESHKWPRTIIETSWNTCSGGSREGARGNSPPPAPSQHPKPYACFFLLPSFYDPPAPGGANVAMWKSPPYWRLTHKNPGVFPLSARYPPGLWARSRTISRPPPQPPGLGPPNQNPESATEHFYTFILWLEGYNGTSRTTYAVNMLLCEIFPFPLMISPFPWLGNVFI